MTKRQYRERQRVLKVFFSVYINSCKKLQFYRNISFISTSINLSFYDELKQETRWVRSKAVLCEVKVNVSLFLSERLPRRPNSAA